MQLRAVETYDIVVKITSWLSRKDLYATVRVNNLWFTASKRFLWRSIQLRDALELLGPVEKLNKIPQSSTVHIEDSKWERFELYRHHVQMLEGKYSDSTALLHVLGACYNWPMNPDGTSFLFPACRDLAWRAKGSQIEIQLFRALITPHVDFVFLTLTSRARRVWLFEFCKMLTVKLSRLNGLYIFYKRQCTKFNHLTSFYELLRKFSSTLTLVDISGTLFRPETTACLSEMPNLQSSIIGNPGLRHDALYPAIDYTIGDQSPPIRLTSLTYLRFLSLVPQHTVLNFLSRLSLPALADLTWEMPLVDIDLESFLRKIPSICPNIDRLALGVLRAPKTYTVKWNSVQSLLNCKKLNYLALCCLQVDMTLDNLTELLRGCHDPCGWRALQVFSVEDFEFNTALGLYARHAQNIVFIGLHAHDKEGIRPFSGTTSAASLPSYLKENDANFGTYVEAHSSLTQLTQQNGISFPFLKGLNMGDHVLTENSVGALGSFLLGISEYPVITFAGSIEYTQKIHEHMARFYNETVKITQRPYTLKTHRFLQTFAEDNLIAMSAG